MSSYLIDGYNLFFKLQEDILPLEEKREEFIFLLDKEAEDLQLQISIVFDSHQKNAQDFGSKKLLKNLEVIFSPKNLSADEYLLEFLEWNAKNITLVTSDVGLTKKACYLGAKTESIEKFIAFILRRRKKKKQKGKPELKDTDANLKRYLKEFERNLDETDEH